MIRKVAEKLTRQKMFSYQNVVKQISPKDFPELSREVQGRVVNGDEAEANQFPYQVSIRAISNKSVSLCGGSILSNEYILTAGHCTKGYKKFEIGFGSSLLQAPLFRVVANSKLEHPGFDSKSLANVSLTKTPTKIHHRQSFFSGHFID